MPSKQSSMQPYMPPRRFTAAYLRVGEEAPRTAEEKKRRHQDLNIIYGRKDGLMKKMFELWEKSNKIAKTPVQFSMKFLGRWYIFNSEHGQTRNSWFPTEEEVDETSMKTKLYTPERMRLAAEARAATQRETERNTLNEEIDGRYEDDDERPDSMSYLHDADSINNLDKEALPRSNERRVTMEGLPTVSNDSTFGAFRPVDTGNSYQPVDMSQLNNVKGVNSDCNAYTQSRGHAGDQACGVMDRNFVKLDNHNANNASCNGAGAGASAGRHTVSASMFTDRRNTATMTNDPRSVANTSIINNGDITVASAVDDQRDNNGLLGVRSDGINVMSDTTNNAGWLHHGQEMGTPMVEQDVATDHTDSNSTHASCVDLLDTCGNFSDVECNNSEALPEHGPQAEPQLYRSETFRPFTPPPASPPGTMASRCTAFQVVLDPPQSRKGRPGQQGRVGGKPVKASGAGRTNRQAPKTVGRPRGQNAGAHVQKRPVRRLQPIDGPLRSIESISKGAQKSAAQERPLRQRQVVDYAESD